MNRFLAAWRFLTVFPTPGRWGATEADLAGSVPFFPVVGLVLGGLGAGLAWGLGWLAVPPLLSAALLVAALLSFSGGLHLDGLSDAADGLLGGRSREAMLAIMKDSRAGPMGVAAVVVVLLLKFAALASLPGALRWRGVLLLPLAGRCAMVVHMALLPYVRAEGLGTVFGSRRPVPAAAWAAVLFGGVCWALLGLPGLAVWGGCLGVTVLLAGYLYRKIGGATGDTYGAVCEIVEAVAAALLAGWPGPFEGELR